MTDNERRQRPKVSNQVNNAYKKFKVQSYQVNKLNNVVKINVNKISYELNAELHQSFLIFSNGEIISEAEINFANTKKSLLPPLRFGSEWIINKKMEKINWFGDFEGLDVYIEKDTAFDYQGYLNNIYFEFHCTESGGALVNYGSPEEISEIAFSFCN